MKISLLQYQRRKEIKIKITNSELLTKEVLKGLYTWEGMATKVHRKSEIGTVVVQEELRLKAWPWMCKVELKLIGESEDNNITDIKEFKALKLICGTGGEVVIQFNPGDNTSLTKEFLLFALDPVMPLGRWEEEIWEKWVQSGNRN